MPCSRYTVSYLVENKDCTEEASVRLQAILVTRGEEVGGAEMSVTVRVRSRLEDKRAVVREEPMKPAAPVMSMDGIMMDKSLRVFM